CIDVWIPTFKGVNYDEYLTLSILNEMREKIINGTPPEYSNLYQDYWKYEIDECPDIQKIVSTLKTIISLEHIEIFHANLIFIEEDDLQIRKTSKDFELTEDINLYKYIDENSNLYSKSSFRTNITDFDKHSLINLSIEDKSRYKSKDDELENLEISDNDSQSNSSLQSQKTFQTKKLDFKDKLLLSSIFE
ncbi:4278_t:CDS:2, partial [Funneliformis mosseae]